MINTKKISKTFNFYMKTNKLVGREGVKVKVLHITGHEGPDGE